MFEIPTLADASPLPPPGLYFDIDFPTYQSWPAVNATLVKALLHSSEYALHTLTHPETDKAAYALGRLYHTLSTQPLLAEGEFVRRPDTYEASRTTGRGEAKPTVTEAKPWHSGASYCKERIAEWEGAGLTVVPPADYDHAEAMAAKLREHPHVGPLAKGAAVEVCIVWIDPATDLPCKCRLDALKNGIILDMKSTQLAAADAFFNQAYRLKYFIPCAMYVDAVNAVAPGDDDTWFVYVAQEKYPPYAIALYDVRDNSDAASFDYLLYGRASYQPMLMHLKWCIEHDKWPGYGDDPRDMLLPAWAKEASDYEIR